MTNPSSNDCPFCERIQSDNVLVQNGHAAGFPDGYPISPGHMLIVPLRHEADFFALSDKEQAAILEIVRDLQRSLARTTDATAFNLGLNSGADAGQTVGHAHLHLIPRYSGDVDDPRGGIRWIIPGKAVYWD